jgi:hypothetical protein
MRRADEQIVVFAERRLLAFAVNFRGGCHQGRHPGCGAALRAKLRFRAGWWRARGWAISPRDPRRRRPRDGRWILPARPVPATPRTWRFSPRSCGVWGWVFTAPRFPRLPVEKSSTTTTRVSFGNRRSTRCAPMNPAPPVTRMWVVASFQGLCDGFGQFLAVLRIGDLFGFDGIGKISPSIKRRGGCGLATHREIVRGARRDRCGRSLAATRCAGGSRNAGFAHHKHCWENQARIIRITARQRGRHAGWREAIGFQSRRTLIAIAAGVEMQTDEEIRALGFGKRHAFRQGHGDIVRAGHATRQPLCSSSGARRRAQSSV